MFEPQHGTSSEEEVDSDTAQDQPERWNPTYDRVLAMRLIAKFNMPTEMWLLPRNGCSGGPFGPRR